MLLILAATGMTVSAADAGFKFVESDGGKTLTIQAYGDLTTASQTSTTTVFSAAANGNVFTNITNNSGTSVTPQAAYNSSATYYYATREYTQVFDGGAPIKNTNVWVMCNTLLDKELRLQRVCTYTTYITMGLILVVKRISCYNLSMTHTMDINNSLSLATGKSEPVNWAHYYVYSTSEISLMGDRSHTWY